MRDFVEVRLAVGLLLVRRVAGVLEILHLLAHLGFRLLEAPDLRLEATQRFLVRLDPLLVILPLVLQGPDARVDLRAALLEERGLGRHRLELRPKAAQFLGEGRTAAHQFLHSRRDLLGRRLDDGLLPLVPFRLQGFERFRELRKVFLDALRGLLREIESILPLGEVLVRGGEPRGEFSSFRFQRTGLHLDGSALAAGVFDRALEVQDLLSDSVEKVGDVLGVRLGLAQLFRDLLHLARGARPELDRGALHVAADHRPRGLD